MRLPDGGRRIAGTPGRSWRQCLTGTWLINRTWEVSVNLSLGSKLWI
jgi:hypothetical protein